MDGCEAVLMLGILAGCIGESVEALDVQTFGDVVGIDQAGNHSKL